MSLQDCTGKGGQAYRDYVGLQAAEALNAEWQGHIDGAIARDTPQQPLLMSIVTSQEQAVAGLFAQVQRLAAGLVRLGAVDPDPKTEVGNLRHPEDQSDPLYRLRQVEVQLEQATRSVDALLGKLEEVV